MTNSRAGIPSPHRHGRRGFSLVETLVGMTLISIAILSVARLDYNVMRRTLDVSRLSYGNATMLRQVNRFVSINYDSLGAHMGCVTVTTGPTPNTACATLTTPSTGVKRVTIIMTLTGVTARPDTVIVERTSASGNNPFNTPMMMTPGRTARRGFTMTEMIVAVIIIAILGASMTRLLVSQAHLFQKAAAQRGTRSVTRSAMNMIDSDLRMVEATNGVVSATSTQLVVRSPYAVGVVCGTSGGVTTVSIAPVDSTQWANAGLSGYAWRDTLGVYTYQESNVTVASGTPSVCTNNSIATMTGGKVIAVSPQMPAGAVVGAFIFFEEQLNYEFKASVAVPGTIGLWRTVVKNGSTDELVSPFTSNAAFKFYVLNRDTSQAAVPSPLSNIRGFEFVLAARSVNTPVGSTGPITTTVNTSVFFRNRLN